MHEDTNNLQITLPITVVLVLLTAIIVGCIIILIVLYMHKRAKSRQESISENACSCFSEWIIEVCVL